MPTKKHHKAPPGDIEPRTALLHHGQTPLKPLWGDARKPRIIPILPVSSRPRCALTHLHPPTIIQRQKL